MISNIISISSSIFVPELHKSVLKEVFYLLCYFMQLLILLASTIKVFAKFICFELTLGWSFPFGTTSFRNDYTFFAGTLRQIWILTYYKVQHLFLMFVPMRRIYLQTSSSSVHRTNFVWIGSSRKSKHFAGQCQSVLLIG